MKTTLTIKEKFFLVSFAICFIISGILIAGQLPIFIHDNDIQDCPDDDSWKTLLDNSLTSGDISSSLPSDTDISHTTEQDYTSNNSDNKETSKFENEYTTAAPTELPSNKNDTLIYTTVDNSYFDDALFVGDSRMEGIKEYGDIKNATFFAASGLDIFKLDKKELELPGQGKKNFSTVLSENKYGKIYIMTGLNEAGYKFNSIMNKYASVIAQIKTAQPDAIIYLCGNLHVSAEKDKTDEYRNNTNLNRINEGISFLADNKTIFYIDINNDKFNDSDNCLDSSLTFDGIHFIGKYYKEWCQWFREHTVSIS